MGLWSRLVRTLRTDRRERYDDEIDEEIQFHLAMKQRDGVGAREARWRFGPADAIRVETRAAGVVQWLESLLQDVRYGVRQLRQTPAIAIAVILSLTIGIGANTAIFAVVDTALIKSLPVPDPGSLVVVNWRFKGWPDKLCTGHSGNGDDEVRSSFGPGLYRNLAREQSAVAALIGFADAEFAGIAPREGVPQRVMLQWVSDNFFQGLGVTPALGRPFLPDDDRPGREPVVILSHRLWQQQFGGRPTVIDEPLRINGVLTRIIGVAPPGFFGNQIGTWSDVYAPLGARVLIGPDRNGPVAAFRGQIVQGHQALIEQESFWWVQMMARLKPGADPAAARDRLAQLYRRLVVPEGVSVTAADVPDLVFRPGARGFDTLSGDQAQALWILLLLVTLVLLIVCANVANLLLSRAVARQRNAALRLALGAGRGRLLRQQLVESVLLAAVGAMGGLALGAILPSTLVSLTRVGLDTHGVDLGLNPRVLAYTVGVSLLAALIFGGAPAIRMANADVNGALKASGRAVLAGRLRLPRILVIVQIALCLTVLVAAGLLGRSLARLKGQDIGFEREHVAYVSVNPFRAGYHQAQIGPYANRLRDALAAVPGVTRAGFVMQRPLAGGMSSRFAHVVGRAATNVPSSLEVRLHQVGDGLIEALGLSLIAGRTLAAQDLSANPPRVVVIDERLAHQLFPDGDAVGRRMAFGRAEAGNEEWREIVGVVSASRFDSLRVEAQPTVYQPWQPGDTLGATIHVAIRTSVDPRTLFGAFRHAATSADASVPLDEINTQTGLIDGLLRTELMLSLLSNAFSVIALLLAGVGLAGLLVYSVSRRTNEIGIRIALGAAPTHVASMVLGDSLRLVAFGVLVGLPCAYAVARMLRGTLFDLQPADPISALLALVTLSAVATLAAWLPARRAARIDPIAALRDE